MDLDTSNPHCPFHAWAGGTFSDPSAEERKRRKELGLPELEAISSFSAIAHPRKSHSQQATSEEEEEARRQKRHLLRSSTASMI